VSDHCAEIGEPYVPTAPVINMHEWRLSHLSSTERAIFLAQQPKPIEPRDPWADLHMVNMSDKRDMLRVGARLGLHIHEVHGLDEKLHCLCPKRERCRSPGKHPIISEWETAPFDFDRVDRALLREPRTSLGIRLGPQPAGFSLICIDIDGPRELLAPLEERFGKLPRTLTAASGNGVHLFFRWPAGEELPANTKLGGIKKIDIRSRRGQVICAPSRHYSGRSYKWIDAVEPAEIEL
jgi:hypothetical protein